MIITKVYRQTFRAKQENSNHCQALRQQLLLSLVADFAHQRSRTSAGEMLSALYRMRRIIRR